MNVVVTGGAGFIGSAVTRELLANGHGVTVIDNLSNGRISNLEGLEGVRLIEGDIRDASTLDDALAGADGVCHLAAVVGNVRSIRDPFEDASVNITGTIAVLKAMERRGVTRLVYSSSSAIYGEAPGLPVTEDMPCEPDSPYGVSKLAAEKYCLCYGRLNGWPVACPRYFNVYGERQYNDAYGNVIPIFAARLTRGEALTIFGDGEQTRDFVHVSDVARANVLALEAGASGPFNIASAASVTVNRLAELMIEASSRSVAIEHVEPRPGEVRHSLASTQRAEAVLGYRPSRSLEDGLAGYFEWLTNAGARS